MKFIAVEMPPGRRQLALDWGADVAIDPGDVDPVEAVKELTRRRRGQDVGLYVLG